MINTRRFMENMYYHAVAILPCLIGVSQMLLREILTPLKTFQDTCVLSVNIWHHVVECISYTYTYPTSPNYGIAHSLNFKL